MTRPLRSSRAWSARAPGSGLDRPRSMSRPTPATGSRSCRPRTSPARTRRHAAAYHFGSQGPGDVFSNHASHTNRLIPVYVFGRKADLGAVTGPNSRYRDPEEGQGALRVPARAHRQPRGRVRRPERPLPRPEGGRRARGQAPVHRLVRRPGLADHAGRRDRQDGQGLHRGEGLGPDLPGLHGRRLGAVRLFVTSPTHDKNTPDVDAQTVAIRPRASAAATTPGSPARTPGRSGRSARRPPATSRGSRPDAKDRAGVQAAGGVLHAYTDSAPSAAEFASGASRTTTASTSPTTAGSSDPSSTSSRRRAGRSAP